MVPSPVEADVAAAVDGVGTLCDELEFFLEASAACPAFAAETAKPAVDA